MAVENLRRMTSRGIDYLSAGLYSEQSHFVLELIQNADDNQYAAGVEPTLRVTVHQDGVTFENNELGFTRANVLALCNVGDSTKHGMKGLIGHKGIGFKSVFSVSQRPEIHSRCYHFMLELEEPPALVASRKRNAPKSELVAFAAASSG
eukprot:m51a1_g11413 putative serine threonine protein kinase (149) ;mRNA; r:15843-16720